MRAHPSIKEIIVFYFKAVFVFGLVLATVFFAFWYDTNSDDSLTDTIAIDGTATRDVTPDIVEVTIGTYLEGNDVVKLQEDANSAINTATESIKALGIEEENIRTSNYNLSSDYYWDDDTDEYYVDVTLTVKITNLQDREDENIVGTVLSTAASANLNQVRSLFYDISNREEILEELKLEAIENAKSKKDSYADASGLKLGKLKDISFGGGDYYYPMYDYATSEAGYAEDKALDNPISIEVGQSTLEASVSLYYEVK